jgi:hypothetical protein
VLFSPLLMVGLPMTMIGYWLMSGWFVVALDREERLVLTGAVRKGE